MMAGLRRAIGWLAALLLVAALALTGRALIETQPEDLPWTPLSLDQPIGTFTAAKLAHLGGRPGQCEAMLRAAGVRLTPAPPRHDAPTCGYDDGVRLRTSDSMPVGLHPAGVVTSCPVAAALVLWQRDVIAPAAARAYRSRVVGIDHVGSYNCRRIDSRATGDWSEHATANALDVAGFRLANGKRVTVAKDWHGPGRDARFLREVRDGACRVFTTVLSPDYNALHRDHLHLDEADRGAIGWRACR